MRIKKVFSEYQKYRDGGDGYQFRCPGCEMDHVIWVGPGKQPIWEWNGSVDLPTFKPSLLVRWHKEKAAPGLNSVCHTFITEGKIQFLDDCTHALRGQTVDLAEIS